MVTLTWSWHYGIHFVSQSILTRKLEIRKMTYNNFTKREKQVVDLLVNGYSAPQIAEQLFIAMTSVNTHLENIKEKVNVKSLLGVTISLIKNKTIPDDCFIITDEIPCKLTHREKEILDLICEEMTSKEIANKLFVGISTVESHRKNILAKVQLKNTNEVVSCYLRGLLKITLPNDDEFDNGLERPYDLTKRQFQILGRLVNGQSTQEIADDLAITLHSVASHKGRIFEKLGVNSSNEAVLKAINEDFYVMQIVREIKFEEQYFKAGMSILNHFDTVLKQKNPTNTSSVKIEQSGLKVRMIIDYKDGREREVIEKTLFHYGELLKGNIDPTDFFIEEDHIQQFNNELQLASLRQELEEKRLQSSKKIRKLRRKVGNQKDKIIRVTAQRDELRRIVGNSVIDGMRYHTKVPTDSEVLFNRTEVDALLVLHHNLKFSELFKEFDKILTRKRKQIKNSSTLKILINDLGQVQARYTAYERNRSILGIWSVEEAEIQFNKVSNSILALVNSLEVSEQD